MKKYKVIRKRNGTENKTAKIYFEDGKPVGVYVQDIYTEEESVSSEYDFIEIEGQDND